MLEIDVYSGAAVVTAGPGADAVLEHLSPSAPASWETALVGTEVAADLVSAVDDNAAGCFPHETVAVDGKIVLVSRGSCDYATKALHVQAAGGVGMLVYDNVEATDLPVMEGQ